MLIKPPFRKADAFGQGHYHASRGNRRHNGVDIACWPGSIVLAIHPGEVTKIGYPYADHLQYRYVEITDPSGLRFRYFYVDPIVKLKQQILQHQEVGVVQDLEPLYKGITPHCHIEIKDKYGAFIDPTGFV